MFDFSHASYPALEAKLNDLTSRAEYLTQKHSEEPPLTWHEFQETHPAEQKHGFHGALMGGIIGMIAAFPITLLTGVSGMAAMALVMGGSSLAGAAIGSYFPMSVDKRDEQVTAYQTYLDTFEKEHPAQTIERQPSQSLRPTPLSFAPKSSYSGVER